MAKRFISKETGLPVTRLEIVEAFERDELKRPMTADELQMYLDELEHLEVTGDWRGND